MARSVIYFPDATEVPSAGSVIAGARGLAVLLLDYRGYGGDPGTPSESGLALDALASTDALDELGSPPSRTRYLGESLGDVGAHHYPCPPR